MATLPAQGGSTGTWGTELNAWLETEHNSDGSHNSDTFIDSLGAKLIISGAGSIITKDALLIYLKE